MSTLIALRAEVAKTRSTAALYHTLISASLIPLIFVLNILTHGLPDEESSMKDPLTSIFKISGTLNSIAIFPMFVVVLCTLLAQIEYRNQTWKQVLAAPHSKMSVFVSKFITVQFLMLLFIVATHAFMWLIAVFAHFKIPELDMLHRRLDVPDMLGDLGTMYLTTFALSAIQFCIALRFKNFIVGIAVGLALWLTGTLIALEMKAPFAVYFPYSFPSLSIKDDTTAFNLRSVIYGGVFLLLGFLDFRRAEKA